MKKYINFTLVIIASLFFPKIVTYISIMYILAKYIYKNRNFDYIDYEPKNIEEKIYINLYYSLVPIASIVFVLILVVIHTYLTMK